MPNSSPLAAALAALTLVSAGQAVADAEQWNWIEIQSLSMGPTATRDVAAPGPAEPAAMLVPAVQKVREAAARTSSELTPQERAAYVGGNQSMTVGAARSETVKAGPLTPLDDARLKAAPAPRAAPYLEMRLENAMISSYSIGGNGGSPAGPGGVSAHRGGEKSPGVFTQQMSPIRGDAKEATGARSGVTPMLIQHSAQGMHAPGTPQRSPVADGTSNTLMIGEKHVRPAPAAPAIRR